MTGLLLIAAFAALTAVLVRAVRRERALDESIARHPAGKARPVEDANAVNQPHECIPSDLRAATAGMRNTFGRWWTYSFTEDVADALVGTAAGRALLRRKFDERNRVDAVESARRQWDGDA